MKNLSVCNEYHHELTLLSMVLSTLASPLWVNVLILVFFNISMNLYGCFTPEIDHMLLFGQFWHAITKSLRWREDDS